MRTYILEQASRVGSGDTIVVLFSDEGMMKCMVCRGSSTENLASY